MYKKKRIDLFWEYHFSEYLLPEMDAFVRIATNKIMSIFADIESEAKEIEKQALHDLSRRLDPESHDHEYFVERAFEIGLSHYETMMSLSQSTINLLTVGLYHLFEQHLFLLYRRELLHPSEENDLSLLTWKIMKERFAELKINFDDIDGFGTVSNLKLAADCIKHAEGRACKKLKERLPTAFNKPGLSDDRLNNLYTDPRVYLPLMGEDIYITIDIFNGFAEGIRTFWKNFWETVRRDQYEEHWLERYDAPNW